METIKIEITESTLEYLERYQNWLKLQMGVAKNDGLKGVIKKHMKYNENRIECVKHELKNLT